MKKETAFLTMWGILEKGPHSPCWVSSYGLLDLNHIGTIISKKPGAERAGDKMGEIQDLDVG
jgi:hypothetical protein